MGGRSRGEAIMNGVMCVCVCDGVTLIFWDGDMTGVGGEFSLEAGCTVMLTNPTP